MFWPFNPFAVTLTIARPGEPVRHVVFPRQGAHSSWLELCLYLGDDFRPEWMDPKDADIHTEFHVCGNADAFYHQSQRYLYHLTQYHLEGWKNQAYAFVFDLMADATTKTIIDYGCGIGADGLWLLDKGLRVSFADLDNPCTRYLRWRLAHRTDTDHVRFYDIEKDEIPVHDIVFCMDVLEHLPPVEHIPFLERLGDLGQAVVLNMVDDRSADGTVHHPVDVEGLTAWLADYGPVAWKDLHEKADGSKVRFVVYGKGVVECPSV